LHFAGRVATATAAGAWTGLLHIRGGNELGQFSGVAALCSMAAVTATAASALA